MKEKVKRGLIILLGVSIQMSMYNYVNAYGSTRFKLYKHKKGKWKKVEIVSKKSKTLRPIEANGSRTEKIICKKYFGKKLSKGKYKLKWVQSKKFSIE